MTRNVLVLVADLVSVIAFSSSRRCYLSFVSEIHSHTLTNKVTIMKIFATAVLLASSAISASAFTAVAPVSVGSALRMADSPDPVDKSLRGIDAEGSYDPVAGDNGALTRNNNDEVWVQQVRYIYIYVFLL